VTSSALSSTSLVQTDANAKATQRNNFIFIIKDPTTRNNFKFILKHVYFLKNNLAYQKQSSLSKIFYLSFVWKVNWSKRHLLFVTCSKRHLIKTSSFICYLFETSLDQNVIFYLLLVRNVTWSKRHLSINKSFVTWSKRHLSISHLLLDRNVICLKCQLIETSSVIF
jgi:hypothetical protein